MLTMQLYQEQRVCILVDVQNMYYSAKNLYNCKVNFNEILKNGLKGRKLIRGIAYAIKADVRDEHNFHEALNNIGFEVKTKELLVFYGGHKKGDWDIGIAMDAVRASEKVDTIVVVSGDGDFKELYEYVRGKGCRIEVMAFGKTASSSIKDYVDDFIDMDKNKKYLIPLKPVRNNANNNSGNTAGNNQNNNANNSENNVINNANSEMNSNENKSTINSNNVANNNYRRQNNQNYNKHRHSKQNFGFRQHQKNNAQGQNQVQDQNRIQSQKPNEQNEQQHVQKEQGSNEVSAKPVPSANLLSKLVSKVMKSDNKSKPSAPKINTNSKKTVVNSAKKKKA